MVGAMYLSMASAAASGDGALVRHCTVGGIGLGEQVVLMGCMGMALLTEHRPATGEQFLVVGAVRRVAIEAAFPNRCVLPQERTALFLVAAIAKLIDCVRF